MIENLVYNIQNKIVCVKCENEELNLYPEGLPEKSYLEAGFTEIGLQIWCKKHKINICHIDFNGNKLKADFRCIETKIN